MGGLYVPFEVLLAKKNTHAAALAKQVDDLNKFLHYNSHLLDQDKLKELEETVSWSWCLHAGLLSGNQYRLEREDRL